MRTDLRQNFRSSPPKSEGKTTFSPPIIFFMKYQLEIFNFSNLASSNVVLIGSSIAEYSYFEDGL